MEETVHYIMLPSTSVVTLKEFPFSPCYLSPKSDFSFHELTSRWHLPATLVAKCGHMTKSITTAVVECMEGVGGGVGGTRGKKLQSAGEKLGREEWREWALTN